MSLVENQPLHLPKIVHPASRLDRDPNSLNIQARGVSRASSLGELADRYSNNNLKPYEIAENAFKKSKKNSFNSNSSYEFNIPDNVNAVYSTDVNKVSIPVFENKNNNPNNKQVKGSRPGSSASSVSSFRSTSLPQSIDIEEYYTLIKEKAKNNFHEIKTKFRNADPDGKGGVSKEAFAHIIASILGPSKPLSHQHYLKLLDRMGLKKIPIIRYEEFIGCINDSKAEFSDWIDPVRSNSSFPIPVPRKATQVFVILKEKAKLRTSDMTKLIPQLNGGSPNKLFKFELLSSINSMGIKIDSEEFDKLWKKFDPENLGYTKSEAFLKRLGIDVDSNEFNDSSVANLNDLFKTDEDPAVNIPYANVSLDHPVNKYKVKNASKKNTNPIEKWLKKKFRNGFSKMKHSFEEMDTLKTGEVRRDQFLNVLRQHGLPLENNLLDAFLDRCEVKITKNSSLISYVDFLERFQNRSDKGIAYRFITSGEMDDDRSFSAIGQVERKLLRLFQNDFLGLLEKFRKIDRNKMNVISKQEFRAAIESHFSMELSDAEFEEFARDVPRDSSDRIRYLEFMTKFDTDSSSTLFDSQSMTGEEFKPKLMKKYEPILEENEEPDSPRKNYTGRSIKELNKIIKKQIKENYKDVEKAWSEVDSQNSNEMNKDMMWQLFKKVKVDPPITRDEIDLLWKEFILKDNKRLEYWQFIRHFGYSKKSAAYQNAKVAPPKRGDNDMMLTSNKLGRDSILIRGSVQSKLILQFDVLKRSFAEIDPYNTNYLLRDEFEEILKELCPELNKQEMDFIYSKYENPADGRINYIEFLAPYAPKRAREQPPDNVKHTDDLPSSRLDMNDPLTLKLRMKLTEHYKELRRIFKQHDFKQNGYVTFSAFKEAIKSLKCNLSDDDMFSLMRRLDKDVTGMINYNKFINEIIKP